MRELIVAREVENKTQSIFVGFLCKFTGYNFGKEDATESRFCTHKEMIVLNMFIVL